jgi:CRISPR-associated protein Csb2
MSDQALLIELRFLDGRYHGVGDWPPSPFRLFQALVAGAYGGRWGNEPREPKDAAFRWLERLPPPHVVAPPPIEGRAMTYYVPNNDADTIGGDPHRVSEIRAAKQVQPKLLPADASILYAWRFGGSNAKQDAKLARRKALAAEAGANADMEADADAGAMEVANGNASRLCDLAERLHTCGWGIDAAYASAHVASWDEIEARLRGAGAVARPALTETLAPGAASDPTTSRSMTSGGAVRCPTAGSFDSLEQRHRAMAQRLDVRPHGRSVITLFRQPPKARCRNVTYECPPTRLLFELRPADNSRPFSPVPLRRAVDVATSVRDLAARRLTAAAVDTDTYTDSGIESAIVGRRLNPVEGNRRVRFVPLPSIGARHTDPSIRRVMIEIPPECPVTAADVSWAVSGQRLPVIDAAAATAWPTTDGVNEITSAESSDTVLVASDDIRMLERYGVPTTSASTAGIGTNGRGANGFTRWCTVTPAALPMRGSQGRNRRTGSERLADDHQRCGAVLDALRHAGFDTQGVRVRVQREPFLPRGLRAEQSAGGRFEGARLHHVEVMFPRPVCGPVIIGDGRWLGLGIMAPAVETLDSFYVFTVPPRSWRVADGPSLARALRRAVMARAGQYAKGGQLATFFSGHENDGRPAEARHHQHLFYLTDDVDGDGFIDRLAIVAPHLADPSSPPDRRALFQLARAVTGLEQVRAGALGVVDLTRSAPPDERDAIFGNGRAWTSRTTYRPTRHPKRSADVDEWLVRDITQECFRRGLPQPSVEVVESIAGPKGGLLAKLRLTFPKPIVGPLVLGAESHFGAGVFAVGR